MQQRILRHNYFNLSLVTLLTASSLVGFSQESVRAQIDTVANFTPPPLQAPGNREAGGSRSDTCTDTTDATGLLAMVPDTHVGLTNQASPELLAYVPLNNAERTELRIFKESTGEAVFTGEITLPRDTTGSGYQYQASIITISLASEAITLEPDENYLWALLMVCNVNNRAEDIVVQSVVQRVGDRYLSTLSSDVMAQLMGLDAAPQDEKLTIYSVAGLWQDLLVELSGLVQESPDLYASTWTALLTNQGIGMVANAPLYASDLQPLDTP
jgi:hypothetical protein